MTATAAEVDVAGEKERRLHEIGTRLAAMKAEAAVLRRERDGLIEELWAPPFSRTTRRLAALGRVSHARVAKLLRHPAPTT